MRWQTRRSSTFLDGVRHDAALVADHLINGALGRLGTGERHEPTAGTSSWSGARVAGAATAMLLARAGLRVLCVDRSRHGSDTLSTHALMRGGVLQLQRWGLLDAVRRGRHPAPCGAPSSTTATEQVAVSIKPAAGIDALYAPRRTVLDALLVDAAVRAGATVEFGTPVVGLLPGRRRIG